jgi:hypothetical protein
MMETQPIVIHICQVCAVKTNLEKDSPVKLHRRKGDGLKKRQAPTAVGPAQQKYLRKWERAQLCHKVIKGLKHRRAIFLPGDLALMQSPTTGQIPELHGPTVKNVRQF